MRAALLSFLLFGAALAPGVASAQSATTRAAVTESTSNALGEPNTVVAETALTPPAPIAETVPSERHRHAVWTPGYWGWEEARFVWHHGRYRTPPERGMRWVEPRWMARPHGWALVSGGWTAEPEPEPEPFVAWPGRRPARD